MQLTYAPFIAYTYETVYKSGRLRQDADCLSHRPVYAPDHQNEDDFYNFFSISGLLSIREEQRQDDGLQAIMECLDATSPPICQSACSFFATVSSTAGTCDLMAQNSS